MNTSDTPRYTLKQYTRLIIAFFGALVLLSIYQYVVLYAMGVVDIIISTSFLLALVHQMGYASFAGLICVPLFNFLENWRPKRGFRAVAGILLVLLVFETLLVGYYMLFLSPLGYKIESFTFNKSWPQLSTSWGILVATALALGVIIWMFRKTYLLTKKHYHHIAKMYPFTIVLLSLFVATLFLDGKPINQNKTQYLATRVFKNSKRHEQKSESDKFKNSEIVWINSVFSGKNRDKAYLTAKDLAYDKEYEKSLLLGRYILSKVPDHIDTKVLMGRVNAWKGAYNEAIKILKAAIETNPDYVDAYSALLDVYYWSGQIEEAIMLLEAIDDSKLETTEIETKIERAKQEHLKSRAKSASKEAEIAIIDEE